MHHHFISQIRPLFQSKGSVCGLNIETHRTFQNWTEDVILNGLKCKNFSLCCWWWYKQNLFEISYLQVTRFIQGTLLQNHLLAIIFPTTHPLFYIVFLNPSLEVKEILNHLLLCILKRPDNEC